MNFTLEIIPSLLQAGFKQASADNAREKFGNLADDIRSTPALNYNTSVAAVYSSRIEGEDIDLESFITHKKVGSQLEQTGIAQRADDLYEAYIFAQDNQLDELGIHYAHQLITRNMLQETHRGKYRTNSMYITGANGDVDYVAAEPDTIFIEMAKLYHDINTLIDANLDFEEVLYFAAMIHLVFVKIHPYEDGNGRTARLLEKWFLAEKLGSKAWHIASEKYYYENQELYFSSIKNTGIEYTALDYSQATPFLLMLAQSVG